MNKAKLVLQTSANLCFPRIFLVLLLVLFASAYTAPGDLKFLLELYNSTDGENWMEGFTWTKGISLGLDPCDDSDYFKGLQCSGTLGDPNRRITSIWLSYMQLNGTIPSDLGNLDQLQLLYLTQNGLQGQIPESICKLKNLTNMEMALNSLSGPIPNCIGDMQKLITVDLRSNQLSGTIPASLGRLINLQELLLADNRLTGAIPPELYQAKRVEGLSLSYNRLTGTVPRVFSRYKLKEDPSMTGLRSLDLRANQLEGTYPHVVGILSAV